MLLRLSIRDLAIIDSLVLDFPEGFSALTGETGAGKSIIIGALNLVLGERASSDDVRTGCETAEVEALFDLSDCPRAERLLKDWSLAPEKETGTQVVLRREVSAQGRSRCLVNGKMIPLSQLSQLGDHLVDLHGQHQHQSLLRTELHREILDAFAGDAIAKPLAAYQAVFARHREVAARLRRLDRDERQIERQKDLLEFQIKEIRQVGLELGEDTTLEEERARLQHADALRQNVAQALDALYEGETQQPTVVDLVGRCEDLLAASARLDPSLSALADRLAQARADLSDVASQLRFYVSSLNADPARLAEVEDRLHRIRQLKRKFGATIEEILETAERMEKDLYGLTHSREEQEALETERAALEKEMAHGAEALSALRREAGTRFAKGICRHLADLEMPHVAFEVRLDRLLASQSCALDVLSDNETTGEIAGHSALSTQHSALSSQSSVLSPDVEPGIAFTDGKRYRVTEHGVDNVEFLICTNPGEGLKPLRKIASGGELSRIMLALKVLMSGQEQIPTLVFDEIDTGISGRTGARIGEKMAALGARRQVICITHLPQIAARAARHYAVHKVQEKPAEKAEEQPRKQGKHHQRGKQKEQLRVVTRVELLDSRERLAEIARLLGGQEDSAIALRHARELLSECGSGN
jgi:DNA repair protein RecN (Recombination protein N)